MIGGMRARRWSTRCALSAAALALITSGCTTHGKSAAGTNSSPPAGSPESSTASEPTPLAVSSSPPPAESASSTVASSAALPSPSATVPSASTPSASASPSRTAVPTAPGRPSVGHPCGVSGAPHYAHVVWIWMENHSYGSVIGNSQAPFENSVATQCGSATNNNGVSHPSLPNYLAATGGSTFGVTDDASPSSHQIGADSIFGQVGRAGLSWRAYEESMPKNCDTSPSGSYAVKHNPAAYYQAIRTACDTNDVPLAGFFDHDVAAGSLPSFSFVTPNLCNDTHDCSVQVGDTWLATWVPKILAGPNYSSGNTLVVITWDEGEGSNNRIPTIVIGPSVPAGTVATPRFDHYALLRTTEDLLGLGHLQAAASAPSMGVAFGL